MILGFDIWLHFFGDYLNFKIVLQLYFSKCIFNLLCVFWNMEMELYLLEHLTSMSSCYPHSCLLELAGKQGWLQSEFIKTFNGKSPPDHPLSEPLILNRWVPKPNPTLIGWKTLKTLKRPPVYNRVKSKNGTLWRIQKKNQLLYFFTVSLYGELLLYLFVWRTFLWLHIKVLD